MGRKSAKINLEPARRLSEWLSDVGITQKELGERIGYTQQYISNIVTGKKPLTLEFAKLVSDKVDKPVFDVDGVRDGSEKVLVPWLLGDENTAKTNIEFAKQYTKRADSINSACRILLEASISEVCLREGIQQPTLNDLGEYLFLEAQLRDFSDSLMWNYIKHKQHSHVWGLFDELEKIIKAKTDREKGGR